MPWPCVPQVEHVLRCCASPYQAALSSLVASKLKDEEGGGSARGINNTVMELRSIANHPLLRCAQADHCTAQR